MVKTICSLFLLISGLLLVSQIEENSSSPSKTRKIARISNKPSEDYSDDGFDYGNDDRRGSSRKQAKRINGGRKVGTNEFPFHIGIYDDAGYLCGGVIRADDYIITSAHCAKQINVEKAYVQPGNVRSERTDDARDIHAFCKHPFYFNTYENDLAVIYPKSPLRLSDTVQAILPPYHETQLNATVEAIGLGDYDLDGASYNMLHAVKGKTKQCPFDSNLTLCVTPENGQVCHGDEGSAVVQWENDKPTVIGILGYGPHYCKPGPDFWFTELYYQHQMVHDMYGVCSTIGKHMDNPYYNFTMNLRPKHSGRANHRAKLRA